ncbi:hypothetical protein VFPBJ_07866 [Purpureocillium lilacinum]|uniref:Uncharacterized protein n=1 Tax=Purpureocillium lilacinum TaxID=33203 RepID=A0A179GHP3_PURLI|nr:hypothetical protein VFPBJ_07866 [Purpureocillium lilacinum]
MLTARSSDIPAFVPTTPSPLKPRRRERAIFALPRSRRAGHHVAAIDDVWISRNLLHGGEAIAKPPMIPTARSIIIDFQRQLCKVSRVFGPALPRSCRYGASNFKFDSVAMLVAPASGASSPEISSSEESLRADIDPESCTASFQMQENKVYCL